MRTFSKLRALCAFPETLDKPSKRRDDAAALGKLFHKAIEVWAHTDDTSHFEALPEPARGWALRMKQRWTPPEGLEVELAVGLADLPYPEYVPVKEDPPDSHEYSAIDGKTPLLTAGRADLVWVAEGIVHVADIKTGQFYLGDPSKLRQLQAQGLACLLRETLNQPGLHSVKIGVYYARLGMFDWAPTLAAGTAEWNAAWLDVLNAAKLPATPRPGAHCLGCWDKKACPANPEAEAA